MKRLFKNKRWSRFLPGILLVLVCLSACKREDYPLAISDELNITGYLQKDPEQFSMLTEILERSATAGYLGAYGTYTFFAPTNEAVATWLKSKGKASVAEMDAAELKNMVVYHLIKDTISTASFTDGKLKSITMYGQYLFTGATNQSGKTTYTVNKDSKIVKTNIAAGNGVIHVIDKVLVPPTLTIAAMLESNPKYSIFTQALKETGFYDTLNIANNPDTTRKFLTVVAQTDSVFKVAGINSYAQLKSMYSGGNPRQNTDSLWLFVAYHIIPGANYLADIASATSFKTAAPLEILTAKLKGQTILLNDDDFNGVHEEGIPLDRTLSDNQAVNGLYHSASQNFKIKVRSPTPVYFDLGDQPELKALTSIWRKAGQFTNIGSGKSMSSGIIFPNSSATVMTTYSVDGTTSSNFYAYNDLLSVAIGDGNTARHKYVDFKTPIIIKGKYKVWLCFRTGNLQNLQGTIDPGTSDETILPNIAVLYTYLSGAGVALNDPNSDNLLEANGYKRYTAAPATNANHPARLLGTVDIKTTSTHTIRLTKVGGRDGSATLDMVHFIPVEMDQQYPRFGKDGTRIERPE